MTAELLKIEGLGAGYKAYNILNNLHLDLNEGELIAVVGPNGHGKSTLLRAISGLINIRSGCIEFLGNNIVGRKPYQIVTDGIVHVPQGDLLFPQMTVLENLQMGAYACDSKATVAKRLAQVFALLPKLDERRFQTANTLSGGERRMCGIARGLMAGGKILMLDEPSLGLAPIIIDQIYELVDRLRENGHSIILVEENVARIADKVDRVYLIDNGEIAWQGAGAALMDSGEILETYLGA